MANIENLKPFTTQNASYYGRIGGIASGQARRRKALIHKHTKNFMKAYDIINNMSNEEYNNLLQEYTQKEQEEITRLFRPTKEQQKAMYKQFKKLK